MLLSKWYPIDLWILSFPVPLLSIWGLFCAHQLQLVSPSPSYPKFFWYGSFCFVLRSLARSMYLSLFSLSFIFTLWSTGTARSTIWQLLIFLWLFTFTGSGRLAKIKWSVSISKYQRGLCISFSRIDSGLCIHYLFVSSNFNFFFFLPNSQWITFPTQSCLVLYSFCTNLLHSLIIVSSLSPHNLYLRLIYF